MDGGHGFPGTRVVELRGLTKSYATDGPPVRALRGVDLMVGRGEFVAVMGPSGCGKSTMLNLIAGLDRPDAGEISVAGLSLCDLDERELAGVRRSHIGFVFQQPMFLAGADVLENVEFAALVAGIPHRAARERAREVLDLLGLADRVAQSPARLSGGQRQRLAIARALVHRPTLLLADEPTGALDSAGGEEVLALFARLHAEAQAVLVVTHDATVAANARRTVTMRDGRMCDATDDVAQAPVAALP